MRDYQATETLLRDLAAATFPKADVHTDVRKVFYSRGKRRVLAIIICSERRLTQRTILKNIKALFNMLGFRPAVYIGFAFHELMEDDEGKEIPVHEYEVLTTTTAWRLHNGVKTLRRYRGPVSRAKLLDILSPHFELHEVMRALG